MGHPCQWSKAKWGVETGPKLYKGDLARVLRDERKDKKAAKRRKLDEVASVGSTKPQAVPPTQASCQVVHFGDLTKFERAVDDPSLSLATVSGLRMQIRSEKTREEREVVALTEILELRLEHVNWLVERFNHRIRALKRGGAEVVTREVEVEVEDGEEGDSEVPESEAEGEPPSSPTA